MHLVERLDNFMHIPNPRRAMRLPKDSKRRGFTLIEILVVIAIITLLAGLTIANVGKLFGGSQIDIAKLFVSQSMKTPLVTYRLQMGSYPSSEGTKVPIMDPWGEAYQYRYPGTHNKEGYDLWSKGPDKTDATDDDIGNW
jgi:general secretion pathway protein G